MEPKKKETEVTYWHPAFYADIQIELKDDADNLTFENEHQLGTKPKEIDVLIIKKDKSRPVKKNIGRIFRKHNILEYKGPGDSLSVDDFYKVYGYTCFYKADVSYVNSIPMSELTITFVSEKYPRDLIRHLKMEKKYQVEMIESGIYYVKGDSIPIQIIVTRKLPEGENLWLKSLTNRLKDLEMAKELINDYLENKANNLYKSVMETIIRANQETFEEVNGMDGLENIVMEIVQEKFDRKLKEEVGKAKEKMREEVTQQVKEEVTQQVKEEVTEQVTQQVTQRTKLQECITLIKKKCQKNKSLSLIADEMESSAEELSFVYDAIVRNPEKTVEEIYEMVHEYVHDQIN